MPSLPSGRILTIEVTQDEQSTYREFADNNLENLKQKSKELLIKRQWYEAKKNKKIPDEQYLKNFNIILDELPPLPEAVAYGTDPETDEPLFAFPAIAYHSTFDSPGYSIAIEYFASKEEAEKTQAKTLDIIEQAKAIQREKEEMQRLLNLSKELLEKNETNFNMIINNYTEYGLSDKDKEEISDQLRQAKMKLEYRPKEAFTILQKVDERINQALNYQEQKRLAAMKVEEAIKNIMELVLCVIGGYKMDCVLIQNMM